jgi:predicted enzyme related to lactoylglutathione lyase
MTTDQTTVQPGEAAAGLLAGSVSWFEVGTPDPEAAKAFYGEMFGWSFADDEQDGGYQIATTGIGHPIRGGIFNTDGRAPGYAVFYVVVPDVAQACGRAKALGGSVIVGPVPTPSGLVFAHLRDRDGNHFGIYRPPSGEPS